MAAACGNSTSDSTSIRLQLVLEPGVPVLGLDFLVPASAAGLGTDGQPE